MKSTVYEHSTQSDMNQNITQVFKVQDLDWNRLETVGISRQKLEESGNMELLLQGEESEIIPLKLHTPHLYITMDATLKIVEGTDGKPIIEINGINNEA